MICGPYVFRLSEAKVLLPVALGYQLRMVRFRVVPVL